MKKATKYLLAAVLSILTSAPYAYNIGQATTYSYLNWSVAFNAPGVTNCSRLVFDATGDLVNSDSMVIYGTMNCGTGGYGMTGNLFITADGSLSVYMTAAGYNVYCSRVVGWYGTCTVYDVEGVQRGTGWIQLQ